MLSNNTPAQIRHFSDDDLDYVIDYGSVNERIDIARTEKLRRNSKSRPAADQRTQVGCATADGRPAAGYETLIANVWPGQPLYLKSDCTFIGKILNVESEHSFPDGNESAAVLIEFADGSFDWIPRKAVQQIYLTK